MEPRVDYVLEVVHEDPEITTLGDELGNADSLPSQPKICESISVQADMGEHLMATTIIELVALMQ